MKRILGRLALFAAGLVVLSGSIAVPAAEAEFMDDQFILLANQSRTVWVTGYTFEGVRLIMQGDGNWFSTP